jgi:hypothetical protein
VAAGAQASHKGSFGFGGGPTRLVIHRRDKSVRRRVVSPKLHGERTLSRRGEQGLWGQYLGDSILASQASQARGGQHNGVIRRVFDLGQAGIDVAADAHHFEIGTQRQDLSSAAW